MLTQLLEPEPQGEKPSPQSKHKRGRGVEQAPLAGSTGTGDKKRAHGNPSTLVRVTTPCGHVHHANFRQSSKDCVLNPASAKRAWSEFCGACVPKINLKPRKCWNTKPGWMVEDLP